MTSAHNIPTTTVTMFSRASTSLRGGGADEAALSITLPRITIAERRLDEDHDARPTWRGRPADALPEDREAAALGSRHAAPSRRWFDAAPTPVAPAAPVAPVEPEPSPEVDATSEAPAPRPCAPIGFARRKTAMRSDRIRAVILACAEAGEITPDWLMSDRRTRRCSLPRHVAVWLLSNAIGLSLTQTVRAFGRRDHTTAHHSCGIVDAAMARAGIVAHDDVEIVDFARDVIAALREGRAA